jgi:hypothetical protein
MSLAICLVTLNIKLLNLMKVAAMYNLQNFRLDVVSMLKALNTHQDNFKIIENVENVDHLHQYILKLYDENFSSHFPTSSDYCSFSLFYAEFSAVSRPNLPQMFEKYNFLCKAIGKSRTVSNHRTVDAKEFLHFD